MAVRHIFMTVLLIVISYSPILVDSQSWWSLGVSGCATPGGSCETCASLQSSNILSVTQSEQCSDDSTPIQAIAKGTRRAIIQCQNLFNNNIWNCSTFGGDHLFGSFVSEGHTQETGFLYSLLTAGATSAVAKACQEQRIPNCPCISPEDISDRDEEGNKLFQACSDNYEWAKNYISSFLGPTDTSDVGSLVDHHNIDIGINAVNTFEKTCRCHGPSGACTIQTCYDKTPEINEVGESLFSKYSGAVEVNLVENTLTKKYPTTVDDILREEDLTYIDNSPSFCAPQPDIGVIGTIGRPCNISQDKPGSCNVLCCGRGNRRIVYQSPVQECEFVFCCDIVCSIVRNDTIVEHRCY